MDSFLNWSRNTEVLPRSWRENRPKLPRSKGVIKTILTNSRPQLQNRSTLVLVLLFTLLTYSSIEIEALKAELSEGKDQLRWLQERAQELDAEKREAKNTIAIAEQTLHRKKNSTRSEIFRLKGEYY
jgi:hypothetical protein